MAKKPRKRPPKRENVLAVVRQKLAAEEFRDTYHTGEERRPERDILIAEVRQVLNGGYHEKSRDRFDEHFKAWTYSIRGKTLDERELRIVVAFDAGDDHLLFVTTRDLDREREDRS